MKLEKKIKIFLGIAYLVIFSVSLWLFFSNFSLSEVSSYNFIKSNSDYFDKIKDNNIFILSIFFLLFSIIWVFLGGFALPVLLSAGFLFGKWIGSILASFGLTIGATLLYIFANYFLKDLIIKKFYKRFSNLNKNFKRREFYFFLIYRFIGGIPFALSNVIPTIFNIKIKNFFFGSIIGMFPQIFIWVSLGSGLDKIIKNNIEVPSIIELVLSPEIYIPILGFIILIILGIIIKNIFYKY